MVILIRTMAWRREELESSGAEEDSRCFVLGSEADGQHRRGAENKRAGRIYLGTVESGKSREH